jgi:hypothetical protein
VIRRIALLVVFSLAALAPSAAAAAGTPTPGFAGSTWGQDQQLTYRWKAGQVPPAWLQSLVHAAAGGVRVSRLSRAATFSFSSSGMGNVGYAEPSGCGSGGIACATRNPPYTYTVMFRRHGQQLDWGVLRWCHALPSWTAGCFDAELSALHEFGHVEILNHLDYQNYPDTVMSRVQAANPQYGWNQHVFGRCDVATLQRKYDVQSWSARYSTCLDLATTATISASATAVRPGTSVTFTANVRTASNSGYERLADNPLHDRTVVLQRAAIGGSSWVDVATMSPQSTAGRYSRAVTINASYQWRVSFRPSGEGIRPAISPAVPVRLQ